MIVYKVTNLIDLKIYIGKTKHSLSDRKSQHKYNALQKNMETYLCRAIRKYGWDNFKWEVIDECETEEHLSLREIYWISYYDSFNRNKGYNMSNGGEGNALIGESNGMYGKKHSEESITKMREVKKGKLLSDEHKKQYKRIIKRCESS